MGGSKVGDGRSGQDRKHRWSGKEAVERKHRWSFSLSFLCHLLLSTTNTAATSGLPSLVCYLSAGRSCGRRRARSARRRRTTSPAFSGISVTSSDRDTFVLGLGLVYGQWGSRGGRWGGRERPGTVQSVVRDSSYTVEYFTLGKHMLLLP